MSFIGGNEIEKRSTDWFLILLYILLAIFGLSAVFSANYQLGVEIEATTAFLKTPFGKQVIWVAISFVVALVIQLFDRRFIIGISPFVYVAINILLLLVLFIGSEQGGAQSWLVIGSFQFQPSELAKFATAGMVATFLSGLDRNIERIPDFLITALIIVIPLLLIVIQGDAGTAIVFTSFIFVLYREGLSGWFLIFYASVIFFFVMSLVLNEYDPKTLTITQSNYPILMLYTGIIASLLSAIVYFKTNILNIIAFVAIGLGIAGLYYLEQQSIPVLYFIAILVGIILLLGFAFFRTQHKAFIVAGAGLIVYYLPHYLNNDLYSLIGLVAFMILALVLFLVFRNNGALGASVLFGTGAYVQLITTILVPMMGKYQLERFLVILDIIKDSRGSGYNLQQSLIAIGSGGFTGKGYLKGTHIRGDFVPEVDTDFIICPIGEELGFIGIAVLILLFLFLLVRIVMVAERQTSNYARIFGYCVASIFFFHFLINVSMVIGLAPVIGIPLPFISRGGSAFLGFTILLFTFIRLDSDKKNVVQ